MVERIDIVVGERGSRVVRRRLDEIGDASDRTRSRLDLLGRGLAALGGAVALQQAIGEIVEFQTAIAEVSTLVDTAQFNVAGLTDAILDQSAAFGQAPVSQAQAAYQIISAGASNAAEATELLTASNTLAVAGVTDVAVAADGLTTILNAYGLAATEASNVSDTLFVGVRAGKTTVDELSGSLGRVAPLAASAGVNFNELTAAVSALTTGGISTNEAVTGVRGVLAAIVRPTQEARDAAEALGLEFSAAALESQGLEAFLGNLIDATGGSTDQLAQLFGGVEALVPVLALTGEAGENFSQILEDLGDSAGITQEAFDKIAASPGFQLDRIAAGFTAELIRAGNAIVQAFVPALTLIADNIDVIFNVLEAFVILLSVQLVRVAIPAAIAGIRALGVAIAANPIGAIITAITVAISLLVAFSDQILVTGDGITTLADVGVATFDVLSEGVATVADAFAAAFSSAEQSAEDAGDGINITFQGVLTFIARVIDGVVGLFAGLGRAVAVIIANLAAGIVEFFVGAFNTVASLATSFVNGLISAINPISEALGNGTIGQIEALQISGPRASRQVGADIATAFVEGFNSVQVAQGFVGEVFDRASARAAARQVEAGATEGATEATMDNTEAVLENVAARAAQAASDSPSFGEVIQSLRIENQLLRENGIEREVLREQLAAQQQLERGLILDERQLIRELVIQNDELSRRSDLLNELNGPQQQLSQRLEDLESLYEDGRISIEQYTRAIEESQPQVVQALTQENRLLQENVSNREILAAQIAAERELGRELLPDEAQRIANLVTENQLLRDQEDVFSQIRGPLNDVLAQQDALEALFADGRITLDEYNEAMRELNVELTSLDNTLQGGIENGLARIAAQANDLGSNISDVVVGAFDDATNAIVDFVTTGEFSIRNFVSNILTELIRLNTQSLLGGLFGGGGGGGLLGGLFGGGGGGGGGLGGLFSGLFGFQNGGEFTVGSSTSIGRIPGIDNRLVAFRAQDGEQVSITPRNQARGGPVQSSVNQVFNIQTPDADSFRQSQSQIQSRQAAGLQRARNRR